MVRRASLAVPVLGIASLAAGQTCVDSTCFVDQGAAGVITLGNLRGGMSVIDYDADGYFDLVIAESSGEPNRLFHNIADAARPGNRTFMEVTSGSGLDDAEGVARYSFGVVVADYDDDGRPDIYFTGYEGFDNSSGLLYRNNGDGTFANVSVSSGVRVNGDKPQSASWSDYDLDGDLDLFLGNVSPSARCVRLFRNKGDGSFTDASNILPMIAGVSTSYSHTWMDYDTDGDPDCFLLTAGSGPTLLRNDVDGQGQRVFVQAAQGAGFTVLGPAPMGISAGDMDSDGDFDLGITTAQVGTYYRNNGNGSLTQVFPFTTFFGWGVEWLDADNDGDLDHYQAGSFGQGANADRLIRNLGNGQWDDISPVLNGTVSASQYSVQVDFNNDGRNDIVTVNPGSPGLYVSVYENISTTANHWIEVRARGDGVSVNRDAVGAVIRVRAGGRTQVRQVTSGSSTTATEDPRAHFGLGAASSVEWVEVLWPRTGTVASRTDRFTGPFDAERILTFEPPCRADYNDDRFVTGDDFDAFVADFESGADDADITGDGFVTGDDFDGFVVQFDAGC